LPFWFCGATRWITRIFDPRQCCRSVLSCAFLVGPWTGRDPVQYTIAGVMVATGIALWFLTVLLSRASGHATGE
jgi:hypothetical protein